MLTKEEIELLELYKEQIEDGAKKKKSKKERIDYSLKWKS